MKRRGIALVAILLSLLCGRHSTFAQESRPNILFIAVDDLRPEFGAYGAASVHSPSFDRLAKHRGDHSKIDAIELYDHQTDPQEDVNIAGEPRHATLVAKLTDQWRKGWRGALPK